jgi:hypothetical protein
MSKNYNFQDQEQLLEIALQICEDYEATEFSFGGGTLLSVAYYQHRMSYDIDIFTEDFSFIQNLIDNKLLIAQSLGIDEHSIEASPSAITFILSNHGAGLKLDFLYGDAITDTPYNYIDVLNQKNLKVQTPQEVIARKIKYRDILTVRDFVDFAFVQDKQNMMKELQKQSIDNVDIERYIDIVEQFVNMPKEFLEAELKLLDTSFELTYTILENSIKSIIVPNEKVQIIYDDDFEVVSVDNFNTSYITFAKEYGISHKQLDVELKKLKEFIGSEITYKIILEIPSELVRKLSQN